MGDFDIDGLVRSILIDLSVESKPVRTEPIEVYIDSRVISLADIKNRLGEAKRLFIAPKSVLTPSAKDEIRKRRIEVAVKLPALDAERSSPLWLVVQKPATFPIILLNDFQAKFEQFDTVAAIVDSAMKNLADKIRGVALTRQAATLLREANRNDRIRAIYGFEPKQAAADAMEIDANLLVLHPERIGSRMVETIKNYANR